MSVTDLASVTNQIQKYWSSMFMEELRETHMLPTLVNKTYEGEIKRQGDRVRVSQINYPKGQTLTVGTNADSFDTAELSTSYVDVTATKRFVAAYEFQDLAELQSQIDAQDSAIRQALMFAVGQQINNYLYSLVSPSTSSPDHLIASVTDFNAAQLSGNRKLAATAKWDRSKGWVCLADPSYYSDLLNATTLTSGDYGASDYPVIGGNIALKRFGFNIYEDNSEGLSTYAMAGTATAGADKALCFHPDFLLWCAQTAPTFKVSDLHPTKKFGHVISVDLIGGAALGINGNVKHIFTYNS